MFCINVVSCYTELSARKGILLNVVNGKKKGRGRGIPISQPRMFPNSQQFLVLSETYIPIRK